MPGLIDINAPIQPLEVRVDGQSPKTWSDILDQFTDANIYQTWAYGAVRWMPRNLSHLALYKDGALLAAAQLRIARLPFLPAGIAYLRWGPLCHRKEFELDADIVAQMIDCLREEYCHRRGLALQVIPNANLGDSRGSMYGEALVRSGLQSDSCGTRYRTIVVDLSPEPAVIRSRLDQKWRNQLNRSEKNGLILDVNDSRNAYREFVALYQAMRQRKQFETSVDAEEFCRIQDKLASHARMQIFLARVDGHAIGALVCSLMGDTAIYLLGATNERARELKAAYFLQWQAMLWLKEHGAHQYDLGGIDAEVNPGGYHFKSGLGGSEVTQVPKHTCMGSVFNRGLLAFVNWRSMRR
jgi:lipid II:glycine glycyltransferase (peptidoglycan interpeptide bridge formation enzyme)